jgi:hypothetical protein
MRLLGPAAVLAGLSAVLIAQQDKPTFRAGVDVVTMTVRVVDDAGRSITGLTTDDFVVQIDGRPGEVRSAAYLGSGIDRRTSNAPVGATSIRGGRTVMLLVDDLSFDVPEARVMTAAAERWVNKLEGIDEVGVTTTSGFGSWAGFTRDRSVTTNALRRVVGMSPDWLPRTACNVAVTLPEALSLAERTAPAQIDPEWRSVIARECDGNPCKGDIPGMDMCTPEVRSLVYSMAGQAELSTSRQLDAVSRAIDFMESKSESGLLVILSRGFPGRQTDVIRHFTRSRRSDTLPQAFVLSTTGIEHRADVSGFGKRPLALTVNQLLRDNNSHHQEAARVMADALRAPFQDVIGTPDAAFARINESTAGVYELTVQTALPREGAKLRAAVRVRGRSAAVNVLSTPRPSSVRPAMSPEQQLKHLLTSGGNAHGVRVSASTLVSRHPTEQQLQLTVNATVTGAAAGPLRAMFVLVSESGAVLREGALAPRPVVDESPYRISFTLPVSPGRHRIRLGVIDASGQIGASDQSAVTRLQRLGDYFASDLFVSWAVQNGEPQWLLPDGLPADAARVHLALEVYGSADQPLPESLRVGLRLRPLVSATEPAEMPMTITRREQTARAELTLPTDALPANEQTIEVRVLDRENPIGLIQVVLNKAPSR